MFRHLRRHYQTLKSHLNQQRLLLHLHHPLPKPTRRHLRLNRFQTQHLRLRMNLFLHFHSWPLYSLHHLRRIHIAGSKGRETLQKYQALLRHHR